ncbi:hypothetical protein MJA45_13105 [Paenibacillus aurantius]|uniref:Uncharacterized protein n=1 Tax=Paenibacillus aurantius TaxID=2918900 RepID=A0AA96LKU3_9BACL|nr:hypothetical protein [Paenibacillus aurantius]WNQ13910.1 hypothetical protein MJA45_13105 [Paenibacillus aurantius]
MDMQEFVLKEPVNKKEKRTKQYRDNRVAMILQGIGVLNIICGILIGLSMGNGFLVAYLFGGIVTGVLFIGFGEVIKLLHEINERQKVSMKA